MSTVIMDATAAMSFVTSKKSHVEQQVNEKQYPDIQYPQLIPVDTTAHPFAKTVTYFSSEKIGAADWISGGADDIPMATTERSKSETAVHMAGIGYGYSFEEINQAKMLGYALAAEEAMAARRAYEEMVDRVAMLGDAAKGFQGLTNNTGVTAASATTGNWATANESQILADVNNALGGVATATDYMSYADTLLLPFSKLHFIASKRLGDTQSTILEFLQQKNTYTLLSGKPLTIRGVRGLDTAGAGNTNRMITYRRDPEVLKLHIPMPHRFLPVFQASPLRVEVPGVFRLGGVDIRRKSEVRYTDGI